MSLYSRCCIVMNSTTPGVLFHKSDDTVRVAETASRFRLASDTKSYLHSANKSLSNGKSIFSFHADEEDTMKIMPYCVDTAYDLATVNVCFRVSNLRGRDLPIAPATLS